ncbi:MAG: DUF1565 domain-containing protein [Deltaproteobacteria bacterium]|nr:DUF1565 domain-containing protein [Deltaproteobacteria bacterium]
MPSVRAPAWLCLLALAPACGGEPDTAGVVAGPGSLPAEEPVTCAPGELQQQDGSCRPAGIAPDGCAAGFVSDQASGCYAVLPDDACDEGRMAVPGEAACREVAPCGDSPFGAAPAEDGTEHVDAAYAGGDSDGSAAKPWTTIQQGIKAAAPGAVVAIAAGRYDENVIISGKAVVLWGRCPELVEIAGSASGTAAVFVKKSASGTEIRDLAVTGPKFGVGVSGSEGVVLDRVWIHDTGKRGLALENTLGSTGVTLRRSLVEAASDIAVMAYGATISIEESVVRDTRPGSGQGRGVVARLGSTLSIRASAIERHSLSTICPP